MQNTTRLSNGIEAFVSLLLRNVCIAFFTVISLLMVINVFNRFWPIFALSWFDEVLEGLFAWLVFLGAAELWRENEHFTVTFLPDCLRGSKRGDFLEIALDLISLSFLIVFTYYAFIITMKAGDTTPVLLMPKRLLYACMPLSGLIMIVHSLQKMMASLCHLIGPQKSV